jgi:hypothetical protein
MRQLNAILALALVFSLAAADRADAAFSACGVIDDLPGGGDALGNTPHQIRLNNVNCGGGFFTGTVAEVGAVAGAVNAGLAGFVWIGRFTGVGTFTAATSEVVAAGRYNQSLSYSGRATNTGAFYNARFTAAGNALDAFWPGPVCPAAELGCRVAAQVNLAAGAAALSLSIPFNANGNGVGGSITVGQFNRSLALASDECATTGYCITLSDDFARAVVSIPEPGALVLLLVGFAAMGLAQSQSAKRRRHRMS